MISIEKIREFMYQYDVEKLEMPDKYGFVCDYFEYKYDRKDLNLRLYKNQKMDMPRPHWVLTKFDYLHEDGEYILFEGSESGVEEFICRYIRESKFKEILDDEEGG